MNSQSKWVRTRTVSALTLGMIAWTGLVSAGPIQGATEAKLSLSDRHGGRPVAKAVGETPGRTDLASLVNQLIADGKYEEAQRICEEAIRSTPADAQPVFLLALTHAPWGRLTHHVRVGPGQAGVGPMGLAGRGGKVDEHRFDAVHREAALRYFQQAVSMQPGNFWMRQGLALFLAESADQPQLIGLLPWYDEHRLDSGVADSAAVVAQRLAELGRHELSARFRAIVAKARPRDAAARIALAWALARSGQPDEARSTLEQALADQPSQRQVRRDLARLLLQMGEAEAGLKHLIEMAAGTPQDVELGLEVALARMACQGRSVRSGLDRALRRVVPPAAEPLASAVREMIAVLDRKSPPTGEHLLYFAQRAGDHGQFLVAWAFLKVAEELKAPPFYLNWARSGIFGELNFVDRQLSQLSTCRRLAVGQPGPRIDLNSQKFWFELGKHHFHRYACRSAGKVFAEALRQPDADARNVFHLARTHEELGEFDRAKDLFTSCSAMTEPVEFVKKARKKLNFSRFGGPGTPSAESAPPPAAPPAR